MVVYSLPLPSSEKITNVFHLSDIHIRIGDTKDLSRYDEYIDVFNNYANNIKSHKAVINNSAVSIITGDIFHNKTRLDAFSLTMFNKLIDIITCITPVYIIIGNHDFRQDKPDTPDLITSILTDSVRPNVYFMKDTGHYVAGNIGFGLVTVKDTLIEGTSSGKQVDELPPFPSPHEFPDEVDTTIALFHGTMISCKLQNYSDSIEGYPLSWFNGYDAAMLGDVHLQQIHNADSQGKWKSKKLTWAYPGSLIQQNFGEEIINHGYIDWDIVNKNVQPVNIYNDQGLVKMKYVNDQWQLSQGQKLDTIIKDVMFPKNISIRIFNSYDTDTVNKLKTTLENNNVDFHITFMNNSIESPHDGDGDSEYNVEIMTNLNTPENWVKYIDDKCTGKPMHTEWKSWIKDPENLLQVIVSDALPISLHEKTIKKNTEFQKDIHKANLFENVKTNTFKIKYLDWSWILCFKDKCWFNFDDMQGFTGMVSGKNGSGKTSFLETIAIALFGECTPSKSTHSHSASIIHKNKPKTAKASTTIHFEYNNDIYHIRRTFKANVTEPNKLKEHDVIITSDALTCPLSGIKTTSDWIKQHIGNMDDFIQYTMMTQFDNKDFFTLSDQEQIKTIESSQNIDAVNNLDTILSNAIKIQCSVQSSIQDIYNHNLSTISVFNQEEYEDIVQRIKETEYKVEQMTADVKKLHHKKWSHIDDDDFEKDINNKIKTLQEDIQEIKLDKTYEELLIQKGTIQNTFENEINSLTLIRYDDDITISKHYVEEYEYGSNEKEKIEKVIEEKMKHIEEKNKKINDIRKCIKQRLHDNKQPNSNESCINMEFEKYNSIDSQRVFIEKNIKKLEKILKTYNDYTDKIHTVESQVEEIDKQIIHIQDFNHPFNPNCDQCKTQLWKVNLNTYEHKHDTLNKELVEVKEQFKVFKNNRNFEELREKYSINKDSLEEFHKINIEHVNAQIKAWALYHINAQDIAEYMKNDEIYTNEIDAIDEHISRLIDTINDIPTINSKNAQVLYSEHYQLVTNQARWLGGEKLKYIDQMIALYKKQSNLVQSLEYWNVIQTYKPKRDSYNKLSISISNSNLKLITLKESQNAMGALKKTHDELNNISEYLNDLQVRVNTLHHMSIAFKEYRQYLFNTHILPYVLKRINYIVSQVSENGSLKLLCSLDTVNAKTNSKTKVRESLNWSFSYDNSVLPIEKASGFQRFMFALAMRVSLTKINARIQNRQLFIDEGFTTFDEFHLAKVHDMFESLKSDYDNIIIVSHLNEIKENIKNKIHIDRCDGFSSIQFGEYIRVEELEPKKRGRKKKELFESPIDN